MYPRKKVARLLSTLEPSDKIEKPNRLPPAISFPRRERNENPRQLEDCDRFIHARPRATGDGRGHRSGDHRVRGKRIDHGPRRCVAARSLA
jgi:hypothetical protein